MSFRLIPRPWHSHPNSLGRASYRNYNARALRNMETPGYLSFASLHTASTGVATSVALSATDILLRPANPARWKPGPRDGPTTLTPATFLSMIRGETPAVHAPGFTSQDTARRLEKYIGKCLTPYSHIAGPPVSKVGVAQFEFQAQSANDFAAQRTDAKDRYFAASQTHRNLHKQVAKAAGVSPQEAPWPRIVALIQSMFPDHVVATAREPNPDGREYHAGIYRAIDSGTPVHCDWSPYDSATEDWVINKITHQAVFNLYLAPMAPGGGHTVVYDRQWEHSVLSDRDPESYGYFDEVVEGRDSVTLRPDVGDLVFFNTRNLHRVQKLAAGSEAPASRRITLSSFIGLLPRGVLGDRECVILWS
ncbi:hypothetical protein MCOR31_011959 [Pyricularia oryzae]|nr:hypothetical protein MCOR31_011959 [Pyricularia oryzae]KAI6604655.1 hypothetical protein MCOR12_002237 [Pyricularia oryzae]KAI6642173.1 hypothetical protein MCOR08_000736 [Pyricularia oryzae]